MRLQTRVLIKSNKLLGLDFSVGQNVMNTTQRFFSFLWEKLGKLIICLITFVARKFKQEIFPSSIYVIRLLCYIWDMSRSQQHQACNGLNSGESEIPLQWYARI